MGGPRGSQVLPKGHPKVQFGAFGPDLGGIWAPKWVVTGKARWRDAKQLDTPRQAEGLPLGVLALLHSAEILSRIPPKENPPPDRPAPVHRRAFKMASGIEVLHGRCKKSILGPLLASLGESLWCLFGHLGWPGVALEGIGLLTLCVFGLCFAGPWF